MPLRLVLDTNVVLDIFHWRNPGVIPILTAARAGKATLATNARCVAELRHVLQRRQFGLTDDAADALVGGYLALATQVDAAATPQPLAALPRCKDPDDQKFLELARAAEADLLVTRDKALMTLKRKKFALRSFDIMRPEEVATMLDGKHAAS